MSLTYNASCNRTKVMSQTLWFNSTGTNNAFCNITQHSEYSNIRKNQSPLKLIRSLVQYIYSLPEEKKIQQYCIVLFAKLNQKSWLSRIKHFFVWDSCVDFKAIWQFMAN
jgi:hypothetical protein